MPGTIVPIGAVAVAGTIEITGLFPIAGVIARLAMSAGVTVELSTVHPSLSSISARLRGALGCALVALLALAGGACDGDDADAEARSITAAGTGVQLLELDRELAEELAEELGAPGPVDPGILDDLALCVSDGDDNPRCDGVTEAEKSTTCYCGYGPGGPRYVTTNCAGYPGTHVCCAAACGGAEGGEDGNQ